MKKKTCDELKATAEQACSTSDCDGCQEACENLCDQDKYILACACAGDTLQPMGPAVPAPPEWGVGNLGSSMILPLSGEGNYAGSNPALGSSMILPLSGMGNYAGSNRIPLP